MLHGRGEGHGIGDALAVSCGWYEPSAGRCRSAAPRTRRHGPPPDRQLIAARQASACLGRAGADGSGVRSTSLRQFYGARLAALGQFEAKSGLGLLQAFHHGQLAGSEIDVTPAERAYLATAQAAEDGQQGRDQQRSAPDSLDQFNGLRNVVGLHRLVVDLRWINAFSRIADQQFPANGLSEGLLKNAVHVSDRTRGETAGPSLRPLARALPYASEIWAAFRLASRHRPEGGDDVLVDDARIAFMRLRRDLRLHVVQPARKKLSERDLIWLLVGAAGYRGHQAGAFDLRFALCALKRMPLGAALAGLRVGNVDDNCPMTGERSRIWPFI